MPKISRRHLFTLFSLAFLSTPVISASGKPPINVSRGELALGGYDAVAYFTAGQPIVGSSQFEHRWHDATWRFVSADNRDRFAKEPERYAPQFGGYCAYAVGRGYTASGDPLAWKIVDGQLFLNYSRNVQKLWEQDVAGYIARGRQNWPTVLRK